MAYNIHLGCGALGLGLMCPSIFQAGYRVFIFNRDSTEFENRRIPIEKVKKYDLYAYGDDALSIKVEGIFTYKNEDDLIKLASIDDELILTTSLKKEGIDSSINQIAKILSCRPENATTFIIAGENAVTSKYIKDLLIERGELIREKYIFIDAVVDRICNKPEVTQGTLKIACEKFAAIYLEKTPVKYLAIERLCRGSIFQQVEDIQYIIERKKWLVNSSHLLVNIISHYHGFSSSYHFLSSSRGQGVLPKLLKEILNIFVHSRQILYPENHLNRNDIISFVRSLQDRLSIYPQHIYDAVTRLKSEKNVIDFWDDYHRKISHPFLLYTEVNNESPYFVSMITHMVVDIIKKGDWILPIAELK